MIQVDSIVVIHTIYMEILTSERIDNICAMIGVYPDELSSYKIHSSP